MHLSDFSFYDFETQKQEKQALVSLFFCLYAFDDDCSTLSAADAQGSQSDFQIALLHFVKQTHQNSVSGCTDRMSQCDCSAIDVGFFHKGVTIDPVLLILYRLCLDVSLP